MTWMNTPSGTCAVIGDTTITICKDAASVYHFYACTVIGPKHSRVYVSPCYYDTPEAAQTGAERWIEKMGITQ